jgi:hypothetical protein
MTQEQSQKNNTSGKTILFFTFVVTTLIFIFIYWGLMTQPVGSKGNKPKHLKSHHSFGVE